MEIDLSSGASRATCWAWKFLRKKRLNLWGLLCFVMNTEESLDYFYAVDINKCKCRVEFFA